MMGPQVVDWARLKRLEVPEAPSTSLATKLCLTLLAVCLIFLVKKYRDRRVSLARVSLSEPVWPREPDGS